jgi:hypothetical protein
LAQPPAIGNNRRQRAAPYSGALSLVLGNSAWNARPFSFGGSGVAPRYGDVQFGGTLAGPLRIPRLLRTAAQLTVSYHHGGLHSATSQSALVPTAAQRRGDLSASSAVIRDPRTNAAFPGNVIPVERISPQAVALLAYYPLPGTSTARGANLDKAIVAATTTDAVQVSASRNLSFRTTVAASLAYQRSTTETRGLFDFLDSSRQSSMESAINWTRRVSARLTLRARYQFSRRAAHVIPFFAHRLDVSGDAGIAGNDRAPANWGPPAVLFPDLADLRDANYQRTITTDHGGGLEATVRRGRHNIIAGADVRHGASRLASQPDARGTLAFTGAMTGDPFGDFLLGLPSSSTIAFGRSAVSLAGAAYDAYVTDDWRLSRVTLTLGARYEYEPTLVPLLQPDRRGLEPRLALSWRPVAGSTLVIRSGYGIYRNLGVYQPLAQLLAFQPPYARTLSVQSSADAPLALANPFPESIPSASTFVVQPAFRVGYAHNWHLSVQRDLPGSLTIVASYLGANGSGLMQASLPNTYPAGAANPCPSCGSGYVLIASNGSSLRNAAQLTLRRRLHDGLTASAQYTIARATDNAATFSNAVISPHALSIAQDWRDLDAERGPSPFDQRHLLTMQVQYTSGGGEKTTLTPGLVRRALRNWTLGGQLTAGSGLPFTPVFFSTIGGSGFTGVRPRLTGIPAAPTARGSSANAAAYGAPAPGTWGNAPRNSIRGPALFSFDANLSRAFAVRGRSSVEVRVSATNVLNRVTFSTINTVVTSPQFGLPTAANPMRRLQASLRVRF